MLTAKGRYGMGWIPDYPDFRDYTEEAEEVKKFLMQTQLFKKKTLPKSVDLRQWCSPIEDQGLAEDFWSVIKKEWIDTGEFSR